MTVTTHDFSIKSDTINPAQTYGADLDEDGIKDLTFISRYWDVLGSNDDAWSVEVSIDNEQVQILEIAGSGVRYSHEGFVSNTGPGPWYYEVTTYNCNSDGGVYYKNELNNPQAFLECDPINLDELNWGNLSSELMLANSGSHFRKHFFDDDENLSARDTVIAPTCNPIPSDIKTYLTFRKLEGDCYYIGWVELILTEGNKLEIKRSAISNKPLEI